MVLWQAQPSSPCGIKTLGHRHSLQEEDLSDKVPYAKPLQAIKCQQQIDKRTLKQSIMRKIAKKNWN